MDLELTPVSVDPHSLRARDLMSGYRVSTMGRAFFRSLVAVGGVAIEQRSLTEFGRKRVSNHVEDLVYDARAMYRCGEYRRAIKLLIEPVAASSDAGLLEEVRRAVTSVPWLALGGSQAWSALENFVVAGIVTADWAAERALRVATDLQRAIDAGVGTNCGSRDVESTLAFSSTVCGAVGRALSPLCDRRGCGRRSLPQTASRSISQTEPGATRAVVSVTVLIDWWAHP